MKISELSAEYIADYLRLDEPGDIEIREIEAMRAAAIQYAQGYTGLTDEEMDQFEDITIAILILISDYFENRSPFLDYKYKEENPAVRNILGMHCNNFL